jgi:hypothetical protein
MKRPIVVVAVAALLGLLVLDTQAATRRVTDPDAPRALAEEGRVQVEWNDPNQFHEIKFSHNRFEASRGDWVRTLAKWIRKRAEPRLAAGTSLQVRLLDIERAGEYEPGRYFGGTGGEWVRILRDVYPPRIELEFRVLDDQGQVLQQGQRKLTDLLYLHNIVTTTYSSDPLRYEKSLLTDWVKKEFGRADAVAGR